MIFFRMFLYLSIFTANGYAWDADHHRQWIGVFNKKKFKEDYSFWQEYQWRYNADQGRTQQTLLRFGVLKQVSSAHEVGFLLGLVESGVTQEIRPTIQHTYVHDLDEENILSLRSRLEYRDIEKNSVQSLRYRIHTGFRHLLNLRYSLLISNELFLNLTREQWSGDRAIERNRLFTGLRIDESYGRWEVGYLYQHAPRQTASIQEHIAVLYFYF